MFSIKENKFLLLTSLTMIFKLYNDYLLPPVEAVNGIIWSKNKRNFVEIFSIETFEKMNQQRILVSREIETHDFKGIELKFTSFPVKNMVEFKDNDTTITGVHGDTWNVLSEISNFKLRNIKLNALEYGSESKNGSWSGLIGYIYRNETEIIPRNVLFPSRLRAMDFTLPSWKTQYRFYMKKRLQYHRTWMTELFAYDLWYSIIGLFFAVTLASFTTHILNFNGKNTREHISDLRDHFFYIFSIFCNQGWTPKQLENRSRILLICTRLFTWLLVIAFSSKLISHIAQIRYHSPFNDLESFYKETDYTLIVQPNSFVYSVFQKKYRPIYKTIIDAGRLTQASASEAEKKMCTGNYVGLELQDLVEAKANLPKLCEIVYVGKPYLTTGIAAGVIRGFKYRRTIDLGILKLQEFGIVERIKSQWLRKMSSTDSRQLPKSIKFEHVSAMFAMLACTVILSILILLIENIIYYYHIKIKQMQTHRHKYYYY